MIFYNNLMLILITGGAGYIGSITAQKLLVAYQKTSGI
jgi:UDP-glucose 4-epimerase